MAWRIGDIVVCGEIYNAHKNSVHGVLAFYGNRPNAVKTQVWIAISVYVLVAIIKRKLRVDRPLREILQILSLTLFEKTSLSEALSIRHRTGFEK